MEKSKRLLTNYSTFLVGAKIATMLQACAAGAAEMWGVLNRNCPLTHTR